MRSKQDGNNSCKQLVSCVETCNGPVLLWPTLASLFGNEDCFPPHEPLRYLHVPTKNLPYDSPQMFCSVVEDLSPERMEAVSSGGLPGAFRGPSSS